ncbi:transposase, Mutator family protein [Paraburkholderia xenovorans LB400]|nr:transposase, Mutator family protein [Paraburkholderia xenovorans LB400]
MKRNSGFNVQSVEVDLLKQGSRGNGGAAVGQSCHRRQRHNTRKHIVAQYTDRRYPNWSLSDFLCVRHKLTAKEPLYATQTQRRNNGRTGQGLDLDPELIKQLVPGTLDRATINEQLAALTKAIFERALGGELTHHLGYEKGEAKPASTTNHRNGISRKHLTTDDDTFDVAIPRDREGTFDPILIAKGERRFTGFDDKIIAMYARGLSVREIQGFLLERYGIEVSPDFVSTVTDAVIDEVREWQQRPLEAMYPVVFFDALRVKIRDEGVVRNKAIYLALGVRRDGTRDVLGLWIE